MTGMIEPVENWCRLAFAYKAVPFASWWEEVCEGWRDDLPQAAAPARLRAPDFVSPLALSHFRRLWATGVDVPEMGRKSVSLYPFDPESRYFRYFLDPAAGAPAYHRVTPSSTTGADPCA